jgi:hypothetical protein
MLENLKMMLGFSANDVDEERDSRLRLILSNTTARLKLLMGGLEPPEEMDHIILEVAIIRFNRIGSEGMSSHTVEGESLTFSADDFSGYMDEIQSYLDNQKESTRGKVRFL